MSDQLRILFIGHYYPPEMGGGAMRFHWLTRWLARFGHEVTVLTGMPNYPAGQVFEGYRGKLALKEVMDGVTVQRTWIVPASYKSRLRRLLNYLSFVVSAVITGLISWSGYDVIIGASPPLFVGAIPWMLTRIHPVPWVFDIGDLWPEVAVEAGELSPNGLLTRLAYRLASLLYQEASHLTPVTNSKRLRLIQAAIPTDKITVVDNAADVQLLRPTYALDWRSQLNLERAFVVIYAGLIGLAQGVETIVDVAAALLDQPGIQFVIVGDGVRKARLVSRAQESGLSNLHILPAQPREAIPSLLQAADAAWVPLVSDKLVDAVPSKLLEAWACRRPVILSAAGEAAELVEVAQGGIVTPPGQPDAIVNAVLKMASDPDLTQRLGAQGYKFFEQHFESEMLARRMEQLLLSLHRRQAKG